MGIFSSTGSKEFYQNKKNDEPTTTTTTIIATASISDKCNDEHEHEHKMKKEMAVTKKDFNNTSPELLDMVVANKNENVNVVDGVYKKNEQYNEIVSFKQIKRLEDNNNTETMKEDECFDELIQCNFK